MATAVPHGRLTENIVYFCRALRRAGVPVGPAQTKVAAEAVAMAGFTRRQDFFYTLRACLVSRAEHLDTFEQVFTMFWRDPEFLENMVSMLLPAIQTPREHKTKRDAETRAAEAMLDGLGQDAPPQEREEIEVDAQSTFSRNEVLKAMDFEQMSACELRDAQAALRRLQIPILPLKSRRYAPHPAGRRVDTRAALRAAMRRGGEMIELPRKSPRRRRPNLVVLCDISGSMSVYSRMFMHLLHSMARARGAGWARLHAFTFGTRLTNITRALDARDPDAALRAIGKEAQDWDGGTRIGSALATFHRDWARRVLGQGAVVLLITDGLERDNVEELEEAADRLRLSARRIMWLNPLMRWDGFSPQAQGIRILLPRVDSFHACHSVQSLQDLAQALSDPNPLQMGEKSRLMAML